MMRKGRPVLPGHVVKAMSNYDATAVFSDPVIQTRWSRHANY